MRTLEKKKMVTAAAAGKEECIVLLALSWYHDIQNNISVTGS